MGELGRDPQDSLLADWRVAILHGYRTLFDARHVIAKPVSVPAGGPMREECTLARRVGTHWSRFLLYAPPPPSSTLHHPPTQTCIQPPSTLLPPPCNLDPPHSSTAHQTARPSTPLAPPPAHICTPFAHHLVPRPPSFAAPSCGTCRECPCADSCWIRLD